jgi:hypothetical protein
VEKIIFLVTFAPAILLRTNYAFEFNSIGLITKVWATRVQWNKTYSTTLKRVPFARSEKWNEINF